MTSRVSSEGNWIYAPDRRQPQKIHTFAELGFIATAENLVFHGKTSVGNDVRLPTTGHDELDSCESGIIMVKVNMISHSSIAPRRIPQQKRGQRRVDSFLRAAASVITEMGYERATMSVIAQRSHSSVGSLYQFFPNKLALAEALRNQYVRNIEQSWRTLGRQAALISAEDLTSRLVELQIEIIKNHPVLLALLDVPPVSQARYELIRARIAEVLISHKPRMSRTTALRIASVVLQVSRGLLMLYAQAGARERIAIIEEFKSVLTGYLVPKLKPQGLWGLSKQRRISG